MLYPRQMEFPATSNRARAEERGRQVKMNVVAEPTKGRGKRAAKAHTAPTGAALSELGRQDAALRDHLLDAAVAGATLARDPADRELRREAAQTWKALASGVARHLASEDELVLPWAASQHSVPAEVMNRARERHRKLQSLAKTVAAVSFERGRDADVRRAARALLQLAVHLDDLIDGEERELFPILQRSLFGAHRA
jgi:Hemerythrin HHE cation binding domain